MLLKPYLAIDISTIKPDIRDPISFCDTTQLELQSWQVSLACVFFVLKWQDRKLERSSNFASNAKFTKSKRRYNKSL